MIIAALIVFGSLLIAWIVAPAEPRAGGTIQEAPEVALPRAA